MLPKKPPRSPGKKPTAPTSGLFEAMCAAHGLREPVPEFRFDPGRKWMLDYAWPEARVALEVEGGVFGRGKPCPMCKRRRAGAHSSIERMLSDMEKYNAAAIQGWCVIRCTPDDVQTGKVFEILKRAFGRR